MTPIHVSAGGLIGDLIGGDLGRNLDQWHKNSGQPLDNAFEATLDYYAPGTGTARKFYRNSRTMSDNYNSGRGVSRGYSRNCNNYYDRFGQLRTYCR